MREVHTSPCGESCARRILSLHRQAFSSRERDGDELKMESCGFSCEFSVPR